MPDPEQPVPANIPQPPTASPGASPQPQAAAAPDAAASNPANKPADEFDDYEELTPEIAEEEAIRNDFVIRWAVILLAFLLASTHISDSATLVHIKTGEYMAAHGFLPPRFDVFSYTATDRPWANLSWGFDLIVAGIYALGSFTALSAVKAVLLALAFWIISRVSRPGTPTWWGSVCAGLALIGCHQRLPMLPVLVTYLGLALTIWIVFTWRETPDQPKRLWRLVPLFLVWCNCDSRAWLGLAYVLLYALGDGLGLWLKSSTVLDSGARKHLWKVLGGSIAVTLVHPFWWKSLAAPWLLYSVEYAGIRDFLLETVVDPSNTNVGGNFTFFPMTNEDLWAWQHLSFAGFLAKFLGILAALAVIVSAVVAVVVNRARQDWGLAVALFGFILLAVACLHELPAAGLVAAVVATLSGQSWYVASCRQTYSIETRELLLSRGGRAVTVITLAALGFFGGTGKLRSDSAASPGYGIDQNLSVQLTDLEKLLATDRSFDHQPFNTLLSQGDQLIWVGEKVFCDNRIGVYYSPDSDANILRKMQLAKEGLKVRRTADGQASAAGLRRDSWRKTFDEYGLTHVVVRLTIGNEKDYELLADFLQQPQNWEWTGLGPSAAVFYRAKAKLPNQKDYDKFVESHKIDFRKLAYDDSRAKADADQIHGGRRPIRAASTYKKWFWSTKVESLAEIREAVQLATMSSMPLPRRLDSARTAMAYMAIRRAQAGLSKDPDDIKGYLALAQAYDNLSKIEYQVSLGLRQPRSGVRYLQIVAAYNQALVGDPDNVHAHRRLFQVYQEARKLDLGFRHLRAIDNDLYAHSEMYSNDYAKQIADQIREMNKMIKQVDEQVAKAGAVEADGKNTMARLQTFLQGNCLLRALEELERDSRLTVGNPQLELVRIRLLLETGRVDESFDAASRFAAMTESQGVANWADIISPVFLGQGDYDNAIKYWDGASGEIDRFALTKLLLTMAPRNTDPSAPWPLSTTNAAAGYFYQSPEQSASMKLNAALSLLECGRIKSAELAFREVLEVAPDTQLRPLVSYYLSELTFGEEQVDIFPPSNRIIELFTPEPGE